MKPIIELIREIIALPFYLVATALIFVSLSCGFVAKVIDGDYK